MRALSLPGPAASCARGSRQQQEAAADERLVLPRLRLRSCAAARLRSLPCAGLALVACYTSRAAVAKLARLAMLCLHQRLSGAFAALGAQIHRRPKATLGLSLSFAVCWMVGVAWLDVVVDYDDLWAPHDTESWDDKLEFEAQFGKPSRRLMLLMTATSPTDGNMLTVGRLQSALAVHNLVTGIPGYGSLCARAFEGGPCAVSSVLSAFDFNRTVLGGSNVAQALSLPVVMDTALNRPLVMSTVVGGRSANNTRATALQMAFMLQDMPMVSGEESRVESFETLVLEALKAYSDPAVNVFPMAGRSYKDEADRQINDDFTIVGLAVAVMITYVMVASGSKPPVQSRMLLASTIMVTVGFSLGAGFGLCGYFGIGFNQMSQMCFFILFGVGVDDMFIILEKFNQWDPRQEHDPRTSRIEAALREAGPSITLTTITDVAAFALGATISVPAISDFCKATAACIFFVFFLQVTLFAALLVLDQRRMDAGR